MTTKPGFVLTTCRCPETGTGEWIGTTAETEQVFSGLERALATDGLALSDVVKLRLFYTNHADFPDMNRIREPLFRARFPNGQFPSSTGVITGGRGGVQPRFELEIVAHANKRAFNAPGVIEEWAGVRPPFSHANIAGGVMFVSGQGAYDDDGGLLAEDPTEQAAASLDVLTKILAKAGCGPAHVLSLTAYLTPVALVDRAAIEALMDRYLAGVTAIVTVIPVAGLAFPGMEVEIELCARADATPDHTLTAAASPNGAAAQAIRYGSLLLARSSAGEAPVETCLARAHADLDAALAGVGASRQDAGITTIWFSPATSRSALERIVDGTGEECGNIMLAPLPAATEPSVIIEILGEIR